MLADAVPLTSCQECGKSHRPDIVCFRDVRDPAAFVQGTINRFCRATASRGPIVLSQDERDELHAEGLAILCKLAQEFEPHRDGYEQEGRFSGYAAMYLPRKLGDAWHRLHPEHTLRVQPEGGRKWTYGERAVSLEAVTAEDPDRHALLAVAPSTDAAEVATRLHKALTDRWTRRVQVVVRVGEILAEGGSPSDAAAELGLTSGQVQDAIAEIALVASRLESGD